MATHIELGKQGEQLAEAYLVNNGFTILHRNWRFSHYEIDIIAVKDGLLHFVEVKSRATNQFGFPEENVSKKKVKDLMRAIEEYLFQHQQYTDFHLDLLSVTKGTGTEAEYFFIEDVYL